MLGYSITMQLVFLLRIFTAGCCGALIGFERKSRLKEAGIRTHFIVALASALMMIVSKYGFADLPISSLGVRGADPARIAAQVVSGVGFLGAGAIFVRKQVIKGLTTAAGIWATSGVGLAIGAGLYILGIAGAIMILLVQIFLHKDMWVTRKIPTSEPVKIVAENTEDCMQVITEVLEKHDIEVVNIKSETTEDGKKLVLEMSLKIPYKCEGMEIASYFTGLEGIISVDI